MRINKVLAAAGLGSRREVEELIVQGRVEVDREIVKTLALRVDPQAVTIKVDGITLKQERPVYYALNKPTGVLSTNRDPSGRMRVIDLVPDKARVFCVGRLDRSSEGLMLLTNDGELAQRLAHPSFRIQKRYFVVVSGLMSQEELDKLRKGVHLAEGFARIDGAKIRKHRKGCTELEVLLSEGKNREIRRILARAGHKVVVLRRLSIGPLKLGLMPVGASRELTHAEVKSLYKATEKSAQKPAKDGGKRTSKKPADKPKRPEDDDELLGDDLLSQHLGPDDDTEEQEFSAGAGFSDDMDDEVGAFGGGFDEDEDFDDDFVGDFSGAARAGSVIAFDEDEPSAKPARNAGSRRRKAAARSKPTRSATGPRGKVAGKVAGRATGRGGGDKVASKSRGKTAEPPRGKRAGKQPTGKPGSKPAGSSERGRQAPASGKRAGGRSSNRRGR